MLEVNKTQFVVAIVSVAWIVTELCPFRGKVRGEEVCYRVAQRVCTRLSQNSGFFFLRRYNFKEVLAFPTNSFHLGRFLMQSFQLVILMLTV
jgi:hypothetical protein